MNFRAPPIGQKGVSTEITVTTEMTDAAHVPFAASVVTEDLKSGHGLKPENTENAKTKIQKMQKCT